MTRRWAAWGSILVAAAAASACGRARETLTELQRVRSGTIDVVLLSPHEGLRHGKDTFIIEFRSASGGSLIDVGTVRGNATMPMPGMPMFGSIDVQRAEVAGRYTANGEFSMAGTWRVTVEWDGSAGKGSVTVSSAVQ